MIYDWYKVINKVEFEATGLVSRSVTMILEGLGSKTILVTKANTVSLTIDGIMLSVGLGDKNPFAFEGWAVYLDENDDIWLGVEHAD